MNTLTPLLFKFVSSKIIGNVIVRHRSSIDQNKLKEFREKLKSATNVVFVTGSGISEESGLPAFSGAGTVWRNFTSLALTYPPSFHESPSLYWEFYNYRRELAAKARPNMAHIAIANYELKFGQDKHITTITQNVDSMHSRAGSVNVIELHGNLFETQCTKCNDVAINTDRPICPALANTGSPDVNAVIANIEPEQLPRCGSCGGLLRPHIIWFGESPHDHIQNEATDAISKCDLCVVVSTPSLVPPAAALPPAAAANNATVAEFNVEPAPSPPTFQFYFEGPSSRTLPLALAEY